MNYIDTKEFKEFIATKKIYLDRIYFKSDEDIVDKLKELKIFTKTKTIKDLDKLVYKTKVNDNINSYDCKIISYNSKVTRDECIEKLYENLTIYQNNKFLDINIEQFKEMQNKSYN